MQIRTIVKILSFRWLIFCIYGSIMLFLDNPLQTKKNLKLINDRLKPTIVFLNWFQQKEHRLPANKEFFIWEKSYFHDTNVDINDSINSAIVNYYNKGKFLPSEIKNSSITDWTKNYYLEAWNGDESIYYTSWNKEFTLANEYDKYVGMLIWYLIGLFPFILWRKNKKQRTTLVWQKTG
jgi:hypothetical protein